MDHARFWRWVVFRGVPGINNVIIGAVPALCARCAKTPPFFGTGVMGQRPCQKSLVPALHSSTPSPKANYPSIVRVLQAKPLLWLLLEVRSRMIQRGMLAAPMHPDAPRVRRDLPKGFHLRHLRLCDRHRGGGWVGGELLSLQLIPGVVACCKRWRNTIPASS